MNILKALVASGVVQAALAWFLKSALKVKPGPKVDKVE